MENGTKKVQKILYDFSVPTTVILSLFIASQPHFSIHSTLHLCQLLLTLSTTPHCVNYSSLCQLLLTLSTTTPHSVNNYSSLCQQLLLTLSTTTPHCVNYSSLYQQLLQGQFGSSAGLSIVFQLG